MTCSQFSRGFSENLPRPPVPGSGGGDGDNDTSHHSAKLERVPGTRGKVLAAEKCLTAALSCGNTRSYLDKHSGPESSRSFEPDGCAKDQSGYIEHSSPRSSSSALADLRSLLEDSSGISYFLQFLTALHHSEILEFWLACCGFRKVEDRKLRAVAMVIWKKFLYRGNSLLGVRSSTKQVIRDKLKCTKVDVKIFDEAVLEVETVLSNDYLPQFLNSKDYLEYVRSKSASASPSNQLSSSAGQMSPCSCREEFTKCCDPASVCSEVTSVCRQQPFTAAERYYFGIICECVIVAEFAQY